MKPRVLVVHSGGVGDFICLLPTLERLSESAHVDVAGLPERVGLARVAGLVQGTHDLDAVGFSSVFSAPDARLRAFAALFDRAFVFLEDGDGQIARGLREAGIDDVQCFPGVPPTSWREHATRYYAHCAGLAVELPFQADFGTAEQHAAVIIHPGSGARRKNWPLEHFERLSEELKSAGARVRWCRGPAEEELRAGAFLPPMSLIDLARLLSGAQLYIGNDSGITHLAAATGCPTLAIFGPTNPTIWAPAGPRVRVLRGTPWPDVASAVEAADEMLAQSER